MEGGEKISFAMVHGGRVFEAAELVGCSPEEVLDFSNNINAFYPSEKIEDLLREDLRRLRFYPDVRNCLKALSAFLGVPQGDLWVGSGSSQLIPLVLQALTPEEVLIPVPTFSEYERTARGLGSRVRLFWLPKEEGFRLDPERLLRAISPGTEAVFLCNPNNPTGGFIPGETVVEMAEELRKKGVWLLVDEAFRDFLTAEERPSLEELATRGRVVLLRSLTKALAIPGLRLGYLIAPREVVRRVEELAPPWPVNTLAQMVLEHLEELWEAFEESLPLLLSAKDSLEGELRTSFVVYPSRANFLLIETGLASGGLTERLLRRKVLVRDNRGFRGLEEDFIRVAVRRPEENVRLVEALKEVKDGAR